MKKWVEYVKEKVKSPRSAYNEGKSKVEKAYFPVYLFPFIFCKTFRKLSILRCFLDDGILKLKLIMELRATYVKGVTLYKILQAVCITNLKASS